MRCLELSCGYEPLGILSWINAFNVVYEGKAEILWKYPDKKIRSTFQEWDWPCVIALKEGVKKRPYKIAAQV